MNPLIILKDNLQELTPVQRKVADYIIKNPSDVAFMTVHQLAQVVETSTTTIMRLTNRLEYSGYTEFQEGLQQLVREQTAPHHRLEVNLEQVDKDDLWSNTITSYLQRIQTMSSHISSDQVGEVVRQIVNSRHIYCTSVLSGLPVAQYLRQGLNRTLGNCQLLTADATSEWVDNVINMQSDDLIIVVSFPRYARRIIHLLEAAKKRGTKVVAITDKYSSPVVEYADVVLPCQSTSLAFHNSPIEAMIVADYLISATAIQQSESTKRRLDNINHILTKTRYHQQPMDE
ncbi:MurR/RpiR family transcriptional regulator [Shouchella sp. 1P09AA]|uniref:MurR/RpiR family transcriptional regulator n=1 Tax=unclassified Shouchella TaxID=2893065 RepID=UPI0039A3CED5